MAIQTKRLNWSAKPSAWEQVQSWKEKRAAMREQFAAASAAAGAGFAAAWTNQITGLGELAAQQANARMQAESGARAAKALAQLNVMA
jgi:hypothetical protein